METIYKLSKKYQLDNFTCLVDMTADVFPDADRFAYQDCFDVRAGADFAEKSRPRPRILDVIPAYMLGSSQKLVCVETTWGPTKIPNIFKFYQPMAEISALIEYARGVI